MSKDNKRLFFIKKMTLYAIFCLHLFVAIKRNQYLCQVKQMNYETHLPVMTGRASVFILPSYSNQTVPSFG